MRLTIIPSDGVVLIDGVLKLQPFDLSGCNVPANVHALQWYDTRGWIEFKDDADPFTPKEPNENIEALPAWAQACVQLWEAHPMPVPEVVEITPRDPAA